MSAPVHPLPAGDLDHVLAHTRALWAAARGQSFFITGGTGFFGSWLLESFARANDALALGMRAVVLTRDPAAFLNKAPHLARRTDVKFHQGDLRTFAFPAGHFDYVIHAAADTDVWTKRVTADGLIARLTAGTNHLLDFSAQAGVKCFLHVSSGAVYGTQPASLAGVAEDYPGIADPLPPDAAWAEGKRVAEQLCRAHAARHPYELKIARCFTFVGPHLPLEAKYAIGNFLRDGLRGTPIEVAGDGTSVRSYLYASDLAVWLWTILFRGEAGRPYNVGSPEAVSIAELAGLVNEVFAQRFPVKIMQAVKPGSPVSRYVPSVARAAAELGLQVRIPLPEALRKTAAWYGGAAKL
ncbi:MAG: NAD(P)-dependent oxidoreductase [Lacunisphaera sp.]|nr:NAD(P)-dependent oxidoreductase [Lacunisphaera sp.]